MDPQFWCRPVLHAQRVPDHRIADAGAAKVRRDRCSLVLYPARATHLAALLRRITRRIRWFVSPSTTRRCASILAVVFLVRGEFCERRSPSPSRGGALEHLVEEQF